MTYTLTLNPNVVVRDADQAHIPNSPTNVDYQHYQAWLDAGNTPTPVPPPSKAKQATDWLAGGLTVQFTSNTNLSGTYACVAPANHNINAIATSVAFDSSALPGGGTTVMISDLAGVVHQFDKASFKLLLRAIRDFVYGAQLYVMGQAPSLPSNSVSKSIEELDQVDG